MLFLTFVRGWQSRAGVVTLAPKVFRAAGSFQLSAPLSQEYGPEPLDGSIFVSGGRKEGETKVRGLTVYSSSVLRKVP